MFLFGLLVLVGIVLLVVWLVRGASGAGQTRYGYGQRPDPAIEAARERYARGEITRDELERIEHDLRR